jgi:lysophospholipase L1-like esterase
MADVPVLNHWDVLANPIMLLKASQTGSAPIVLIGDSVTEGFYLNSLAGCPAVNLGFGGARLQSIASRVAGLLPAIKPRAAIVMVSINNACLPDGDPESLSFQADLSGLVYTICQTTRHVALMTITPFETWKPAFAPFRPQVDAINALAMVPYVNRTNGSIWTVGNYYGIPVYDLYSATRAADFTALPGTTIDQVHPSAAGYGVVGTMYQAAATALLAQPN